MGNLWAIFLRIFDNSYLSWVFGMKEKVAKNVAAFWRRFLERFWDNFWAIFGQFLDNFFGDFFIILTSLGCLKWMRKWHRRWRHWAHETASAGRWRTGTSQQVWTRGQTQILEVIWRRRWPRRVDTSCRISSYSFCHWIVSTHVLWPLDFQVKRNTVSTFLDRIKNCFSRTSYDLDNLKNKFLSKNSWFWSISVNKSFSFFGLRSQISLKNIFSLVDKHKRRPSSN